MQRKNIAVERPVFQQPAASGQVYVVDDHADFRESLCVLLDAEGYGISAYASAAAFLSENVHGGCLIADIHMPHMDGIALLGELRRRGISLPVIMITGKSDVALAVKAMKSGAVDFLEKPFAEGALLTSVARALEIYRHEHHAANEARAAMRRMALLTPRERNVLEKITAGCSNKIVAYELGISPRTVEIHRARIMDKLNADSIADLVRLALAAEVGAADPS